jgi:hypothetical protein
MKKVVMMMISVALLGYCAYAQASFPVVTTYQVTGIDVYVNETIPALQDTTWEDGSVQTLVFQVPNTPTQAEIDAYRDKLDMGYIGKLLEFGASGEISYAGHEGTETRASNGTDAVWDFPVANCASCSKTLQMVILSESATGIVYVMQDEDGNQKFRPKLTFVKL